MEVIRRVGRLVQIVACAAVLSWAAGSAVADIDLEWRPLAQTVAVGDPLGVGLYAVSGDTQPQGFSSVQVILSWDPVYLELTGIDPTGALPFFGSSFPPGDSFGINEAAPPTDGDAMWVGLANLGQEVSATPDGSLLTTVTFEALAETPATPVALLVSAQHAPRPPGYTKMLNLEGADVLGALESDAVITVVPEPSCALLLPAMIAGRSLLRRNR